VEVNIERDQKEIVMRCFDSAPHTNCPNQEIHFILIVGYF